MYEKMIQESAGKTSPFIRDKLRISVTDTCNLNCFYCHNEGQGHSGTGHFLPVEYARDIADYLRRGGYRLRKINLTGGEPLMHPDIDEIITVLAGAADSVRLNTNALLLDERRIDELAALGINEYKIGVDSLWTDDCSEIKTENAEHMRKMIAYMKSKGCAVVLNMVITPYNFGLADRMVRFCEETGVDHLKIIEQVEFNFFRTEDYHERRLSAYFDCWDKYRSRCTEFRADIDAGMDDMVMPSGLKIRWCESFCRSRACGTMYTIINALGEIMLCSKSGETYPVSFSPERSVEEIDDDIRRATSRICCVTGGRYLRDYSGREIALHIPDNMWDWSKENGYYWKKPEDIVWGLAHRWGGRGTLLDIGCGLGRNALEFANAGFDVIAADNSEFAVEHVRRVMGDRVRAILADMCSIPLENDSVDCVFAFNTVSHSDDYLISLAANEIMRVLKPGGEAWLTFCSKSSRWWKDENAPLVSENTKLKLKEGPEYGVAHYYADKDMLMRLLRKFEIMYIKHVNDCYYDGRDQDSWHYHVMVRKPADSGMNVPLVRKCL